MMNSRHIKHIISLALLLLAVLFFISCQVKSTPAHIEVESLEKLCKVWGYLKYHHPAFILGEKDWDNELLYILPEIKYESDPKKVNDILYKWAYSLNYDKYNNLKSISINTIKDTPNTSFKADTQWIQDTLYLGEDLSALLRKLNAYLDIDRHLGPVSFEESEIKYNFSNEKYHLEIDFSKDESKLLGLFRVWNVIEYYYPYLDILEDDWAEILPKYIGLMLDAKDKNDYYLTLAMMTSHLHDGHANFTRDNRFILEQSGVYAVPVGIMGVEDNVIVSKVYDDFVELKIGDIIKEVNDECIDDIIERNLRYISNPSKEKIVAPLALYILRSKSENIKLKIQRDEKEIIVNITGYRDKFPNSYQKKSHELLNGNIGLINPNGLVGGAIFEIMQEFKNTEGLIIDLRQYPRSSDLLTAFPLYLDGEFPLWTNQIPSEIVPGLFLINENKKKMTDVNLTKKKLIYNYSKPICLLVDEHSISQSEAIALCLGEYPNVTLIGTNTYGANGNVSTLPIPGGNDFSFSSIGISKAGNIQTQIIGIKPDIVSQPTVKSIAMGKDEILLDAINYISE